MTGVSDAATQGKLPAWNPPPDTLPIGPAVIVNTGRGEVVASKQWFRVPPTRTYIRAWVRNDRSQMHAEVFALTGANGYGDFAPFSVRSVGFGITPVVVTIRMRQLRSSSGVVEPWVLDGPFDGTDQILKGRVDLAIARMSVDGRPVTTVGKGCHTAFPAWVQLVAQDGYSPVAGGDLSGTIDVPRFAGCGHGLDQLLTSFVSGPGSPLQIRQGNILSGSTPPPFELPDRG